MPPKKAQTTAKAASTRKGKATAPTLKSTSRKRAAESSASETEEPRPTKKTSTAKNTAAKTSPNKAATATENPAAKAASPAKPATEAAVPAKTGRPKKQTEEDTEPSPPKRGRGRPRKADSQPPEDEVVPSIEHPTARGARSRSPLKKQTRARTSSPEKKKATAVRSRTQSPPKKNPPAAASPNKRSARQTSEPATPASRKKSKLGFANTPRAAPSKSPARPPANVLGLQRSLRALADASDADDDSGQGIDGRQRSSRRQGSTANKPSPARKLAPKKPARKNVSDNKGLATAAVSDKPDKKDVGRGDVVSFTNPEKIQSPIGTDYYTTDKVTKEVEGPWPNPFFEMMPAPEVWHHRMPNSFPFGETPYYEQLESDRINADLNRSHKERNDGQQNGGMFGGLTSFGKGIVARLSPHKGSDQSPQKASDWKPRNSPWELPDPDPAVLKLLRAGAVPTSPGGSKRKALHHSVHSQPARKRSKS